MHWLFHLGLSSGMPPLREGFPIARQAGGRWGLNARSVSVGFLKTSFQLLGSHCGLIRLQSDTKCSQIKVCSRGSWSFLLHSLNDLIFLLSPIANKGRIPVPVSNIVNFNLAWSVIKLIETLECNTFSGSLRVWQLQEWQRCVSTSCCFCAAERLLGAWEDQRR